MTNVKAFDHYSDLEIIGKILEGEKQLYELLIRRYNPFLYRIGRSYNYNHHDTEDLMQETYINCFYNLGGFEKRSSFKTWITRIMLNNCYHKKQKHSFKFETTLETSHIEKAEPMYHQQKNTEKKVITRELGHVLENALTQLPEDYRLVFTLRELNGLSVAETSKVADISESNVKVRLNRAKQMLRNEIEKVYSPSEIFEFNLIYCDAMVKKVMAQIN